MKFLSILEGHPNTGGPPRILTETSVSTAPDVRHMVKVQCSYMMLSCGGTCGVLLRGRP